MAELDTSLKLIDRTALLTGPCNSINQAIATKLTSLGCNIALVDRNIERTSRFAEQLMSNREVHERFGRAVAIQADLSKSHHVQDAASKVAEAFGGLDIFIDGLLTSEVCEFRDPEALTDIDRLIDVNLRSPLLMTHAVLKFLEGRKRGRVIYLQHDIVGRSLEKNSLLAAIRGGLDSFTKTLSREVQKNNVTVNIVSHGLSEEFLIQQMTPKGSTGERGAGAAAAPSANAALQILKESFPQAVMVNPESVANTVAFLASPLGSGITGQVIPVTQNF